MPAPGKLAVDAAHVAPGSWPVRKYVLVIIGAAIISALAVGISVVLGEPMAGTVLAALPLGILILLKPEVGLFLLVFYLPFEVFGVIGPGFATVTKVLGIFTFLAMMLHALRVGRLELRVGAFWLGLTFAVWSMLTTILAESQYLGWRRVLTTYQMVGLLFVTISLCGDKDRATALCWMLFLSCAVAVFAAFFITPHVLPAQQVLRETAGVNINQHAKNLIGGLFLGPFLLSGRSRRDKILIGLGVLFLLVGLVRTVSRSTYIAVFVGILATTLAYRGAPLLRRLMLSLWATLLLALFAVGGTALGLWELNISEPFVALWERGLEEGGRAWMWRVAFETGIEHPLMGIGPGNFVVSMWERGGQAMVPHNDLLMVFAETGFPGALLYVAFLLAVLRRVWRCDHPWARAGLIGMWTAAVVSSTANPSMTIKGFWLQMAVCILGGTVFAAAGTQQEAEKSAVPVASGPEANGGQPALAAPQQEARR